MKFRIRYADQLVGVLVIIALVSLIFVIFLLGKTQKWFAGTNSYVTYAVTASGLSQNMPVSCRGMTIGNVKSFSLTDDDRIEVTFTIQNQFIDRAKAGSLVEISVSPIGFGSQFIFYPGRGESLKDGAVVPMRDSPEGKKLISQGFADVPDSDDLLASLVGHEMLNDIKKIVKELSITLEDINVAANERASTALGQTVANLQDITASLARSFASNDVIGALESTLVNLSGTLNNMEKTTAHLPGEMPQIRSLLTEARSAIRSADDVLTGARNNPLIRGGIPDRAEVDSSGTNPRNIRF